jgi:hypothetical protein
MVLAPVPTTSLDNNSSPILFSISTECLFNNLDLSIGKPKYFKGKSPNLFMREGDQVKPMILGPALAIRKFLVTL